MNNENMKKSNSHIVWGVVIVLYVIGSILFFMCFNINQVYRSTLVRQFGETVRVVDNPGIYFTNPIQDEISIYCTTCL